MNNDSEARVRADMMFGYDDWDMLAKDEDLDGTDTGPHQTALTMSGTTLGGSWWITPVGPYTDFMIVLKDGSGEPDTYVGYFVSALSGSYSSPFLNGTDPKDISHATLYARIGEMASVPLPAAAWLLLAGLFGLGGLRLRRS